MKALYRKYRPKSLAEVVGQEKVTSVLKNSLEKGKISHAYIFTGPRGTGKTSVARIFAHEINKFPYELEDSYIDIIEIDAASNTGVDNIRELREKATIAPTKGKYKVYIIDEVHMLSKSAFNALLKTLEEPPEHVVFILATTDIEKVPITITSRVQMLNFSLAEKEVMRSHLRKICDLEKINIDDDAIEIIVRRGGGSFRDSLSLLDQISSLAIDNKKITKELVEKSLGLPQDILISELINLYSSANLQKISEKLKEVLSCGIKPETLSEEIINQILEKPESAVLPLLSKLPEVKAPFAEAKLLLALAPISSQPKQPQFAPKPIEKPHFVTEEPTELPTEPSVKPLENSADFSWESYLKSISEKSSGVAMWLKKCKFSLENDILNLYPPTKTVKGILESENNRRILTQYLGKNIGLKINSSMVSPTQAKKDPKISIINDIMGETQEVESGGQIPF